MSDRTDEILSTTLDNYVKSTLEDNVFDDFPLFYWMNERGGGRKVYQDGGYHIVVPLLYGSNSTAKSYSGYDILDTTPQEGIGNASYNWKQYSVSITIDGRSLRQNSGEEQVVNLLKAKIMQAELSLQNKFSEGLYGDGTGNSSKDILGLAAIIDTTPATGTVGGLDAATYTWWRNYAVDASKTSTAYDNLLKYMRKGYNTVSKGRDHPDILISDQATLEDGYEGTVLAGDINFNIGMTDTKLADAGFQNFRFKGAVYMFDRDCPSERLYIINSKYLKLYVHKQCDFITTPFVRPENQDAKVAQILWMGELCCSNRARQGVLYNTAS